MVTFATKGGEIFWDLFLGVLKWDTNRWYMMGYDGMMGWDFLFFLNVCMGTSQKM